MSKNGFMSELENWCPRQVRRKSEGDRVWRDQRRSMALRAGRVDGQRQCPWEGGSSPRPLVVKLLSPPQLRHVPCGQSCMFSFPHNSSVPGSFLTPKIRLWETECVPCPLLIHNNFFFSFCKLLTAKSVNYPG